MLDTIQGIVVCVNLLSGLYNIMAHTKITIKQDLMLPIYNANHIIIGEAKVIIDVVVGKIESFNEPIKDKLYKIRMDQLKEWFKNRHGG